MLKRLISLERNYSVDFDFSKKNLPRFYQKLFKSLYQEIFHSLREQLKQENIEVFIISKDLIWESLKNSYDSCLDKYLEKGSADYFVTINWKYQNNKFILKIVDNGFGIKASTSQQKNKKLHLGGKGKGVNILLNKVADYKQKYGNYCKIDYFFSRFGNGAMIELEFEFPSE